MGKRMFTEEQIKEILKNKNVVRCSAKSITYSPDFKAEALRSYREAGLSPRQIFEVAGFRIETIGSHTPERCLGRWRKKVHRHGLSGLQKDERGRGKGGGRPKKNGLTDQERIEYLEAKVAYLKAENDFLTQLRAARGE
jgi:transposase-like protein